MKIIEDLSFAGKLLYKGSLNSSENLRIVYKIQEEEILLDLSQIEKKTWFYNSTPEVQMSLSRLLGLNLTIHPSGNISVRNLAASGDHSDYYIITATGAAMSYFFCLSIEEVSNTLFEVNLYKVISAK